MFISQYHQPVEPVLKLFERFRPWRSVILYLGHLSSLVGRDRAFHLSTGRGDEFAHGSPRSWIHTKSRH
jgi:hypothetical protein